MENKQTAVEYLSDKLYGFLHPECGKEIQEIFNQALEMERQQMFGYSESNHGIEVVIERCSIIENGVEIFLPKKMAYLAHYLRVNSGKFVTRESILDNVWPGVCVEDRTIDVHIRKLRELFPLIPIKTHKGVGYGWIPSSN